MTNHRIYIFVSVSFKQSASLCTEYMKYHIVSLTFTAKRWLNSMVNRHILWISLKKHMVCTFDIAEVGFCCYYSVETYKIKSITNILWYINYRKYLVINQYLISISNLLSLRCLGPLMNHLLLYDGPRLGLYFYLAEGVKVWYGVKVFLLISCLYSCLIHIPNFTFYFSFQINLLSLAFYTTYFVLIFSIDVVSTHSK